MKRADGLLFVNSLILKVRDGDQEAFLSLFNKYKPLIDSLVSRFVCDDVIKPFEEDLLQEASVVFYNSILTYDESQSDVEFGLYARVCISNALVSQIRVIKKREVTHLEYPEDKEYVPSPAEDLLNRESLRSLYGVIRQKLRNLLK